MRSPRNRRPSRRQSPPLEANRARCCHADTRARLAAMKWRQDCRSVRPLPVRGWRSHHTFAPSRGDRWHAVRSRLPMAVPDTWATTIKTAMNSSSGVGPLGLAANTANSTLIAAPSRKAAASQNAAPAAQAGGGWSTGATVVLSLGATKTIWLNGHGAAHYGHDHEIGQVERSIGPSDAG